MFDGVKFRGEFRSYQQEVLDGADEFLADGKINIVAAPGSGKTILGLELIVRVGKPCLILSPTTTIRDQWGQRFSESFLPEGKKPSDFISYDLKKPAALTSITYQALYSAVEKVKCADGEEVDYSKIDIFKILKEAGVETICLDEAHHLQNEWQRALETFMKRLEGCVTVISLTATPPYDANTNEWKRYVEVCGEIDEEIFVPELVKKGTLCPHQDYVYFNYPSESETEEFKKYGENVACALSELYSGGLLKPFFEELTLRFKDEPFVYSNVDKIKCALALFERAGMVPEKRILRGFPYDGLSKKADATKEAEAALNFFFEQNFCSDTEREILKSHLSKYKLMPRGKVCFEMSDKLKRTLVSSSGKLESISKIVQCESGNLGENLRLLALTDYIRREDMRIIGTQENPSTVSVISVFETLRRSTPLPCGALSGTLVILPVSCANSLIERGGKFTLKPLGDTGYAEYVFSGGNKEKVDLVGGLFERGEINLLVGTKSLLGEGWDSPCINALILASIVGSFMLSNQMRGRAIRVDKNNPDKTANIWHLVTVEPNYIFEESKLGAKFSKIFQDKGELVSGDFETLTRRFNCFVAPAYDTGIIESGIERLSIIKPPYTPENIENINEQMCSLSKKRGELKEVWQTATQGTGHVTNFADVPKEKKLPVFNFVNVGLALLLFAVAAGLTALIIWVCVVPDYGAYRTLIACVGSILAIVAYVMLIRLSYRILAHFSPKKSVKNLAAAVLKTLKELYFVDSGCTLAITDNGAGTYISAGLRHASERDGKLFQTAVAELFSEIVNPRYILVPKNCFGRPKYFYALACPSVFGSKKEYAGQFVRNVKKTMGKLELIYTRGEDGVRILTRCRKFSYINFNESMIRKIQRL